MAAPASGSESPRPAYQRAMDPKMAGSAAVRGTVQEGAPRARDVAMPCDQPVEQVGEHEQGDDDRSPEEHAAGEERARRRGHPEGAKHGDDVGGEARASEPLAERFEDPGDLRSR